MLTEQEQKLLDMLFDICPHWKANILKQIDTADIEREFTGSNMAVIFKVTSDHRINMDIVDPVEIMLGNVDLSQCTVTKINGYPVISENRVHLLDNETISILYIFRNGIIEEIEVFSQVGNILDPILPLDRSRVYNVYDMSILSE